MTAVLLILIGAGLTFFLVRVVVNEQAALLGNALATESAQRAAEYLVHNDLISLNIITGNLSRLNGVVGVTIFDRHHQPLAQSGMVQATPHTLTANADIFTEGNELRGTVEILISPQSALPALTRLDYTLLGWVGFAIALLLFVYRLQQENIKAEDAASSALPIDVSDNHDESTHGEKAEAKPEGLSILPSTGFFPGAMLCIDIVNFATLTQRLSPRMLAELVATYSHTLERACALYHGQITRLLDDQCLVLFSAEKTNEEEALFRAICCAQLFFGVVREVNIERKQRGRVTMQFTAALHHDPSLATEACAIVTWEICTQAGTAGRLTITDTLSNHPLLGERLATDSNHHHLLQIELPLAAGGVNILQDVLALSVMRLNEPYDGLIAQQTKRLMAAAATTTTEISAGSGRPST